MASPLAQETYSLDGSVGFATDLQELQAEVNSLLQDVHRLANMSPVSHFKWALALPPCLGVFRVPASAQSSVLHESGDRSSLHSFRASALAFWRERKRVTDFEWQREFRTLPAHVQAVLGPDKNLLLLAEMLEASNSPDAQLVDSLRGGFKLVGEIPPSGTLPACSPVAPLSLEELWRRAPANNARLILRAASSTLSDEEAAAALRAQTAAEVAAGKARWTPLSATLSEAVCSPRFGVDEGWKFKGSSFVRAVRAIDDFHASNVNEATQVEERVRHEHLDALVAIGQGIWEASGPDRGPAALRLRKDDVVGAYKTLPICADDLPCVAAVTEDTAQTGLALQLFSCPFGALSSVHAWHRVGAALQHVLVELFRILYPRFVDDFFGVDRATPGDTALTGPSGAAFLAREVVQELLGWQLDDAKAVTDAPEAVILGIQVALDDAREVFVFNIPEDKRVNWIAEIEKILELGVLSPAQARKLAGKLSWGATMVFGRSARVYLAALFFHSTRRLSKLSLRLRRALGWWIRFLQSKPCREIPYVPATRPRLVMYTDAAGCGALAWVLAQGNRKQFARAWVPRWLRDRVKPRRQQIGTWELIAAVCGLWHAYTILEPGLEILLFVDSNPALGALLKGTSRQIDWNALVTSIWFAAADRGDVLCPFRVPSAQNLADAPSRAHEEPDKLRTLLEQGFEEVQWRWPEASVWEELW